jgi:hypothetical protein
MPELPVPDQEQIIAQSLTKSVAGLSGIVGESILKARKSRAEDADFLITEQNLPNLALQADLAGVLVGLDLFPKFPVDEQAGLLAIACRSLSNKKTEDLKSGHYTDNEQRDDDKSWVDELDYYYQSFMMIREDYRRKIKS